MAYNSEQERAGEDVDVGTPPHSELHHLFDDMPEETSMPMHRTARHEGGVSLSKTPRHSHWMHRWQHHHGSAAEDGLLVPPPPPEEDHPSPPVDDSKEHAPFSPREEHHPSSPKEEHPKGDAGHEEGTWQAHGSVASQASHSSHNPAAAVAHMAHSMASHLHLPHMPHFHKKSASGDAGHAPPEHQEPHVQKESNHPASDYKEGDVQEGKP